MHAWNPFIINGIIVSLSFSDIWSHIENIIVKQSISVTPEEYKSLKTFAHVILPKTNFYDFHLFICMKCFKIKKRKGAGIPLAIQKCFAQNSNHKYVIIGDVWTPLRTSSKLADMKGCFNEGISTAFAYVHDSLLCM